MKQLNLQRFLISIIVIAFVFTAAGSLLLAQTTGNANLFLQNVLRVNITAMGDAFFAFAVVAFLFIYGDKKQTSMQLLFAVILTLLLVQCIKNIAAGGPWQLYTESNSYLNGKKDLPYNSISSHTAIAFTLAGFIVMTFKKTSLKIMAFVLATCVAYSRIYLADESLSAMLLAIPAAGLSIGIVCFFPEKSGMANLFKRKVERRSKISENLFPA